jgi:hypothetical protein
MKLVTYLRATCAQTVDLYEVQPVLVIPVWQALEAARQPQIFV